MDSSRQHPADRHDTIRVKGARENNLKDLQLEIPKRRLTVFTGVSGSGKSSLVFGTIAAESQRLINETYSAFVQGFMPTLARPDVDLLEGLTTAIIVDQERMGANARSTVGTATDANAMLRILFSRLGQPQIGPPTAYSFNVPTRTASGALNVDKGKGERIVVRDVVYHGGMCPRCEGMGYLSLDRPTGTLSGGESQRTKMIKHLGSSLTNVTYVFDEPTIGLHPHDIQRMNSLLLQLCDKGNTVLVVEHKPEVIAITDYVVDLGPGAGSAGGEVVFAGSVEGLRASNTLTGCHLADRATLKPAVRTSIGVLEVRGANTHNLQHLDVDIPLGVLVVMTGVAGSGKSSLIHRSVAGRDGVVVIDQTNPDPWLAPQQSSNLVLVCSSLFARRLRRLMA